MNKRKVQEILSCRTACAVLAASFRQARNSTKTEKQSTHVFCAVCIIELYKNKRYASIAACFRCLKKSGSLLWLSHFPCADLLVVFYGERKKNALQTIRCINPVFVCRLAEPDLAQPDRQNSSMPTFLMDKFLKMHLFSPYFAAFSSVL